MTSTGTFLRSRFAFLFILLFGATSVNGQCVYTNAGPPILPGTTWQTISLTTVQYMSFDAMAGCQYIFSFCQNGGSYTGDPYLTITDNSNNPLAANDDWCGLGSELSWTCPTTGTYRIHNGNFTCSSDPNTRTLAYWSSCNTTPCSGMPTAGTATADASTFACEGDATLGLTGNTLATDLEYQWQSSPDGINWTNFGTVQTTIPISTGTITQTSYYQCIVTCTNSNQSATSTPITITVTGPTAGTTAPSPSLICNGGTSTIALSGSTTTGVSYQWQSSTDGTNFSNIPGETNSTYTTPPLNAPMYYQAILTCTVNGMSSTSASAMVDTLSSVAPPVNPSSITVACGSPAVLSATPVTGGTIAWYTQQTGGTPVAVGNTVSVFPSSNTTYWAENSLQTEVTSISTTGAVVIDHNNTTGDDRGGIAVSTNYVYYSGDNNTGRFNKADLSGATSLTLRDGFFGDQSTNQLWQLSNGFTLGGTFQGSDNVDRLYALDENLNPTGTVVMLNQSIYLDYGSFVAPGQGYVLLYDGLSGTTYHVNINNGNVTTLGTGTLLFYWPENWAGYGWAEFDGSNYYIIYREDWPSNDISRYDAGTGTSTVLQSFTNLSDMAAIVYDGSFGRMYFHYEGSGQFGGSIETLGYVSVTTSPGCGNNDRSPVQVTVTPGPPPTISPADTTNICTGNSQTYTASAGASYQWYLNGSPIPGATNQTYSASTGGNYSVEVTSMMGCVGMSDTATLTVNSGVIASVSVSPSPNDTICVGTIVNFTATPTNGGTNPSYQWQKNGLNVGINSPLYTGAGLVNGDVITVIMTVGTNICTSTPTATSPAITMSVQTPTTPAVTISANPGTTACADDTVVFTATPTNGGTTPSYQWTVNGGNVGTNSATYSAPAGSLSSGDIVAVVMTPSLICSNPSTAGANVTMTIDPLVTPTVTIAASSLNICQGEQVTFTATDNAPGGTYQWYVNGNPSGPNSATYTYAPGFNDVVTLDFTPPLAGCYDNITVNSNSLGPISVTPGLPTMATATASPTAATAGTLVTVYANLFNFNTSFTIDWYINYNFYTTTTVPYMSYIKGVGQDVIYGVANNSGSGCYLSANTDTVTIDGWATSVASTSAPANIEVYPNPFGKDLIVKGLADGDHVLLLNMLGQTVQEWNIEKANDEQRLSVTDLPAGSYLLNIRDQNGNFKDMKKLQKM